jgi:hypothetical protein
MAYAEVPGSVCMVTFSGTGISWYAYKNPGAGIARASLDGGAWFDVDLYSAGYDMQSRAWGTSGLADGAHSLRIEYTGRSNPSAKGTRINVDCVDIGGTITQAPLLATRYEQTNSLISYAGTWTVSADPGHSGGSYSFASSSATATFAFVGTSFDWYSYRNPGCGIAAVSVDGAAPVDIDLYSAGYDMKARVWGASGLNDTTHTVTVAYTGRNRTGATGTKIGIDFIDIGGTLVGVP